MEKQKHVFVDVEGDNYWKRNASALAHFHAAALADPSSDPVLRALLTLKPSKVLEIGSANGWRLDVARQTWGAQGTGIEPSAAAVADGSRFPDITLHIGTAEALPLPDAQFDCVVFGFCLYLCDRADLFRIAAEADRVLIEGGYIVIYDFFPSSVYRNPYSHRVGLFAHKMDHSRMWTWNPAYVLWRHDVTAHPGADPTDQNERLAITIVRKLPHS